MLAKSLVVLFLTAAADPSPHTLSPSFECTDSAGAKYRAWLQPNRNLLEIVENGKVRELPLSGANLARPPKGPVKPQIYNGWNRRGKDLYQMLDMGTEFYAFYAHEHGSTRVKVSIVVDHRERADLKCKASGIAVTVVGVESEGGAAQRYASLLTEGAAQRSPKGALTPIGVMTVEAALRRLFHSADFKKEQAKASFIENAATAIKNIEVGSIHKIESRLPAPLKEFWKKILEDIKYRYYPEVYRYSSWIKEGARAEPYRDNASVTAGFKEFVASSGYRDKDIRAFFINEITPVLKSLSEEEVNYIALPLSEEAEAFLNQLWAKAVGRKTLADYPEIQQMAAEYAALVETREFAPEKLQRKLSAFLKSPLAANSETMSLFIQAVGPQLQKLTPRQREDLMGWLEEPEKRFLLELLE